MIIIIIITVMIIIDYLSQEAELSSDVMVINDYLSLRKLSCPLRPWLG